MCSSSLYQNFTVDRKFLLKDFLSLHGFDDYVSQALPHDASFRRYFRLINGDKTVILKDSPPEYYNLQPYINISQHLTHNGLPVPKIFNYDINTGFMILEDFGDIHYKQIIESNISDNNLLTNFGNLINIIIKLQKIPLPVFNLPKQTAKSLIEQASIYFEHYNDQDDKFDINVKHCNIFTELMNEIFNQIDIDSNYFVHRDYHMENLMYLKNKDNLSNVGIIDFQDALIGSPVYDLVSLLQDVRTDISADVSQKMLNYYIDMQQILDEENFYASYAVLGLLRNLRINALFKRKIYRDKQMKYAQYLPRVQKYIQINLNHSILKKLKNFMLNLNDK